jgi:glycosyltransferase involved in cell wall biosynthesis
MMALQAQKLPTTEWELLLIDNASDQHFSHDINLDWHHNSRYIREENVGLVHARLRGISDSNGELLVFLDDDNVLNSNYLNIALEIAQRHTMLGAWSGQVLPEYEVDPTEEVQPFLQLLGIRTLSRDIWGNDPRSVHLPMGSGMCVRREVANRYVQEVSHNPLHLSIGHAGSRRSCHADTDLAVTSFDLGLGVGLFRGLILTHLIPTRRLNESYLLQLAENGVAALVVLQIARGSYVEKPIQGWHWLEEKLRYWAATPVERRLIAARQRGKKKGRSMVENLQITPTTSRKAVTH